MAPLASVVIPAYNCADYVAEAVQSVLDQAYPEREIIVVNDGSTDGTLEALHGFGNAIRVVDQENTGPAGARNAGLRAATGDYVALLDADDLWFRASSRGRSSTWTRIPRLARCSPTGRCGSRMPTAGSAVPHGSAAA